MEWQSAHPASYPAPEWATATASEFTHTTKRSRSDGNYNPAENTRITTNFADLARGENRQENLRNALTMMNNRFNTLVYWGNPYNDCYAIELDIISVEMNTTQDGTSSPVMEVLQTHVIDKENGEHHAGTAGNSFSSYVWDYNFNVLLLEHNKNWGSLSVPDSFGKLHDNIFKNFVQSNAYKASFSKVPVICLSVSGKDVYWRTDNEHPVFDIEYAREGVSLTERYFSKVGPQVRYFMPEYGVAPLAFCSTGDLLNNYISLELIATIDTMETFQKIYRPETYNANSTTRQYYQPNLDHLDHSLTKIVYDREERSLSMIEQGKFTQQHSINPHRTLPKQWSANFVPC